MALVDTAVIGKKGGKRRGETLTKKQLSESARNAVNARWKKYRERKAAEAAAAAKAEAKRAGGVKGKAGKGKAGAD